MSNKTGYFDQNTFDEYCELNKFINKIILTSGHILVYFFLRMGEK